MPSSRAARRLSWSSMRASRPQAVGASGTSPWRSRPSRSASSASAGRCAAFARRGRVALVEEQVDRAATPASRAGSSSLAGSAKGIAAFAILSFARVRRLAIVASGDEEGPGDLGGRQAAEEPEAEGGLRIGGEGGVAAEEDEPQHVVVQRGGPASAGGRAGVVGGEGVEGGGRRRVALLVGGGVGAWSAMVVASRSRSPRRASRRIRSIARLRAALISQARGSAGTPRAVQASSAAIADPARNPRRAARRPAAGRAARGYARPVGAQRLLEARARPGRGRHPRGAGRRRLLGRSSRASSGSAAVG